MKPFQTLFTCLAAASLVFGASSAPGQSVAQWTAFETTFTSTATYTNPPQQATLTATFTGPDGKTKTVDGFWDGGQTWRVRFAPDKPGSWKFQTTCSDTSNTGLNEKSGTFECSPPAGDTVFAQHGPLRVSVDGRYLVHADGTPFFWIADTAWNGPLKSTDEEWQQYIRERTRQKFTAVQWVTTQWRAAPDGDRLHQTAFSGRETIEIHPEFFQRLDRKVAALNRAGLLSVPVLLWDNKQTDPGQWLSVKQATLLAKYMVARWGADDVVWILAGDGRYQGLLANRWKEIGRGVFGDRPAAPVTLHPTGMQWYGDAFRDEYWLSILGYQSGHGDDDNTLRWLIDGPPSTAWHRYPYRPIINLEPAYENHLGYQSHKPHPPEDVRRAVYWSLLVSPTAGVSYGGHGVWGWDDGTKPPVDHPNTGTPLPWSKAILMPAAEQMAHVHDFFSQFDWWRLRPAPELVANQPGKTDPKRYIALARTEMRDVTVVYVPQDRTVELAMESLPPSPGISWFDPRTGEKKPAVAVLGDKTIQLPAPEPIGDWLLLMQTEKKTEKKDTAENPTNAAPSEPAQTPAK